MSLDDRSYIKAHYVCKTRFIFFLNNIFKLYNVSHHTVKLDLNRYHSKDFCNLLKVNMFVSIIL